jgi:D-Tyr-tRNAtyr deacylase
MATRAGRGGRVFCRLRRRNKARRFTRSSCALKALGVRVATGVFQAHMAVELVNDGPVTILLDSDKTF